jgi:deoxyribonuclease-4
MPLFGAHCTIAGGCHNALAEAEKLGCQTVQLFVSQPRQWPVTRTANQWTGKPLSDDDVRVFRRTLRRTRLRFPMAHDSYLINLATADDKLYRQSIEAFVIELQHAECLGLRYLVTHPGACLDAGEEYGLARVAKALDEVHGRCAGFRVQVLLETTAGQGSSLGHRFEHLAKILSLVGDPDRLGVCLDTCHVFAAGYELAPEQEYRLTMRTFDKVVGLARLRAFHLNDSVKPLGSRVDRHAHIGEGQLGLEPFRLLVNDRRFRNRPMVIETPKEDKDGRLNMDATNLSILRGLVNQRERSQRSSRSTRSGRTPA